MKYDITKLSTNTIKMVPKGYKEINLAEELNKIIDKIKVRVDNIPQKGYFRNFAENFEIKNPSSNIRSISLCIERDENIEGNVLLLLSVLQEKSKKNYIDSSIMLKCGNRELISKYLENPELKEKLESIISGIAKT